MQEAPTAADRRLLEQLDQAFAAMAGADAAIDVHELQRALGLRSEYLSRRILGLLDANGDGVVRRDEFMAGVRRLVFGTPEEKLAFAFKLHDHNGDGVLERDEIRRMVAIGLAEDDARVSHEEIERLVTALFHQADVNRDGRITAGELEAAVRRRPDLLERMTRSEARWIAPDEDLLARVLAPRRAWPFRAVRAVQNRPTQAAVLALWAVGTVGAMAVGALGVYGRGTPRSEAFWMVSAGCTTAIQFNAGLIVVPVLRRLVTWVRTRRAARWVPVDEAIDFHRYVGNTLYALTAGHVAAAVADYAVQGNLAGHMLQARALTGLGWFAVFTFLWSFSRSAVRRSGHFELFYFSHLLYVAWFVLAGLHAPSVLGVSALPLLGLGAELALRRARRGRKVQVLSLQPLRSGVTRLEMARPKGFTHQPGDWVFLRIPRLARHEWHPFTLSSAPERNTLTVHARTLGNWTGALRTRVEDPSATRDPAAWEVFLDGPYGSPTAHIASARVPVMIGAGIGVTPFASVLESLVLRQQAGTGTDKVEKAYFFWLNRDLFSFEWFRQLLLDLERLDTQQMLSVQIWLTGGHSGASAMGLELAREIVQESGGHDPVSGMRTAMRMEHPDWRTELQAIKSAHAPALPEVFYCGPTGLGRTLRSLCAQLGIPFRQEHF